jgi:hypothetical protein
MERQLCTNISGHQSLQAEVVFAFPIRETKNEKQKTIKTFKSRWKEIIVHDSEQKSIIYFSSKCERTSFLSQDVPCFSNDGRSEFQMTSFFREGRRDGKNYS